MIASKLKLGDEVRVIAPARNLTEVRQDVHHHAIDFWKEKGFNLTFSKNSREVGKYHSSSIASRVEDIHEAFCDPNVKMIITCLAVLILISFYRTWITGLLQNILKFSVVILT